MPINNNIANNLHRHPNTTRSNRRRQRSVRTRLHPVTTALLVAHVIHHVIPRHPVLRRHEQRREVRRSDQTHPNHQTRLDHPLNPGNQGSQGSQGSRTHTPTLPRRIHSGK